jgi:hypothetical protein
MAKLRLSINVLNVRVQLRVRLPGHITLRCVADILYNIAYYNVHNSYITDLKKYHKVGIGHNDWDNMPSTFIKLAAQNTFF